MSFLGASFSTYLRPADGIFGPIVDVISDWGWSLLPQYPGSYNPAGGGQGGIAGPVVVPTPVIAPVPVVYRTDDPGIEAETTWVPPVRTVPVGGGGAEVPRTTVVVGDVATEVEQHPEGDFPAGSIFAPGQAWEPTYDARPKEQLDEDEEPMAHDWGHLIRQGLGAWGGIQQGVGEFNALGPAFAAGTDVTRPSGSAALPPSAAPLQMITGPGGDCGNRRYVTLDRQTGAISCKRRRRRRLLTNRDLADLASLKTITGGGAALNAAVIRAVR